ncbi:MAG: hypothetical protein IPO59_17860 [Betaproteobacteria bacterium]|nr:hypothetical protein [Betaproteobacteria bacterium]
MKAIDADQIHLEQQHRWTRHAGGGLQRGRHPKGEAVPVVRRPHHAAMAALPSAPSSAPR